MLLGNNQDAYDDVLELICEKLPDMLEDEDMRPGGMLRHLFRFWALELVPRQLSAKAG